MSEQQPTPISFNALLPAYLRQLGYESFPCIVELGKRATVFTGTQVLLYERWKGWRGILEYLSFVEHARAHLIAVGSKNANSNAIFIARYHSVVLVMLCRATLDLSANWLAKTFDLKLRRKGHRVLGIELSRALRRKGLNHHATIIEERRQFLNRLDAYRNAWVHRSMGGIIPVSNGKPDLPDSDPRLAVPIEPGLDAFSMEQTQYAARVAKCSEANNGRWLLNVEEFANAFADKTRDLCLDLLSGSLSHSA